MMLRPRTTTIASMTRAAIVALLICQGLPASAQTGVPGVDPVQIPKGNQPPLDINKPAAGKDAPAAPIEDGSTYRVSRFDLGYRTQHPDHPALEAIGEARVKLGVLPTGYVQYREGLPSTTIRVADVVEGTQTTFHSSAIVAVAQAIVADFSARGISGVGVQIDGQQAPVSHHGTHMRVVDHHQVISRGKFIDRRGFEPLQRPLVPMDANSGVQPRELLGCRHDRIVPPWIRPSHSIKDDFRRHVLASRIFSFVASQNLQVKCIFTFQTSRII